MQKSQNRETIERDGSKKVRATYMSPAIVYEGMLTIRAGSPVPNGGNPFDGPPSPFSPPGG